jgi:ribonuclease Z
LFEEKERELKIRKSAIDEYHLSLTEIVQLKRGFDIQREETVIENKACTLPPEKPLQFAYCSDTKYMPSLPAWIQGVDLLYHEATFTEEHIARAKSTGHSTAKQAAEIAKAAGVQKLLLGHFSARFKDTTELLAEAQTIFDQVTCVEDGQEFVL